MFCMLTLNCCHYSTLQKDRCSEGEWENSQAVFMTQLLKKLKEPGEQTRGLASAFMQNPMSFPDRRFLEEGARIIFPSSITRS